MRIVIVSLLLIVSTLVSAQPVDRVEKIRALVEAQGLLATFQQQMALGKENRRRQADQILTQMLGELNAPPSVQMQMKAAMTDFVSATEAPWSAEDVVNEWATLYGPHFTDEELDQLLAYYTSPLAQKEVMIDREVLVQFTTHFQELFKPIIQKATSDFVSHLDTIAKECRCSKKKVRKS